MTTLNQAQARTPMLVANRLMAVLSRCCVVAVVTWGCLNAQGKGRNGDLALRIVADYQDKGSDVVIMLRRASDNLAIPLGVELAGPIPSQPISIHMSNTTVGGVFSAIIEYAHGYRWVEEDGVLNVLPAENRDDLLNVRISRFTVRKANAIQLQSAIGALPEVKAWLQQNGVTERSFYIPVIPLQPNGEPALPRVSIDLKGLTLRQVMNKIVQKGKLGGWSVARYGESNHDLNIQIG